MAKAEHERHESRIQIRLSASDLATIDEQAAKAAVTRSEFIRRRALGKRLVSRFDDQVLSEIRRLGGLQKHLASTYPAERENSNRLLEEIIVTLRQLY